MANLTTSVTQFGLDRLSQYMNSLPPQQWHPIIIQELVKLANPVSVVEDDDAELIDEPIEDGNAPAPEFAQGVCASPETKQFDLYAAAARTLKAESGKAAVAKKADFYRDTGCRVAGIPVYRLCGETIVGAVYRTIEEEKVRRAIESYDAGGPPAR